MTGFRPEIAGRSEIPVYKGADMPLLHEKSDYATRVHGRWWSDEPPAPPPGGFARKKPEAQSAVDFIVRTVMARPGEVSVLAIGPLTNIAMALRQEPGLAERIRKVVVQHDLDWKRFIQLFEERVTRSSVGGRPLR